MCVHVMAGVCVCLAVNSPGCYIWIVNDLTDCNTWVCFFKFYFGIVCVRRCVCVAVNSYACCIWIVNDITDSNNSLFSVSGFFCYSVSE